MAFAIDDTRHDSVAGINITPLVDVMLVLLVIFMIAAPIFTQRINLDLPGVAPPIERTQPPPPIRLRIDAAGQLYWNDSATPASALPAMLEAEHQRTDGGRHFDGPADPADRRQRRSRLRRGRPRAGSGEQRRLDAGGVRAPLTSTVATTAGTWLFEADQVNQRGRVIGQSQTVGSRRRYARTVAPSPA